MESDNNIKLPPDEEILEIIKTMMSGGYETEEEDHIKMRYIREAYPGISDLIFWDKRKLTPEEILEEAKKKRKPIQL